MNHADEGLKLLRSFLDESVFSKFLNSGNDLNQLFYEMEVWNQFGDEEMVYISFLHICIDNWNMKNDWQEIESVFWTLIEYGADVNLDTDYQDILSFFASWNNLSACLKLLICGAKVDYDYLWIGSVDYSIDRALITYGGENGDDNFLKKGNSLVGSSMLHIRPQTVLQNAMKTLKCVESSTFIDLIISVSV